MHGYAEVPSWLSGHLAPLVDPERLIRDIGEPLGQSAPIAFDAALRLCDEGGAADCRAYHAVWQYLRHAGAWHAIRSDGALFVAAAEQLARDGRLGHALVSGAADYSMLAHVAHGARRGGCLPAVDVLDQCATSLHMNQWYAEQRGLKATTHRSTALAFAPERQYDLICTHTFVSWQPFAERPELFRKWGEWLRPGGRVCFSDRVSTLDTPHDAAARERRIDRLISETLARLAERGTKLPCTEAAFADLIRRFGLRFHGDRPAMPREMVESWASEAGLVTDIAIPLADALPGASTTTLLSESRPDRVRMWFQFRRP